MCKEFVFMKCCECHVRIQVEDNKNENMMRPELKSRNVAGRIDVC